MVLRYRCRSEVSRQKQYDHYRLKDIGQKQGFSNKLYELFIFDQFHWGLIQFLEFLAFYNMVNLSVYLDFGILDPNCQLFLRSK